MSELSRVMSPDLRVSKWVLTVEMACCFLLLTLRWLLLVVDGFNPANIKQFLVDPGDNLVLAYLGAMGVLGPCGAFGLVAAFQYIALGRSIRHYPLGGLIVVIALAGMVYAISTLKLGGPGIRPLGMLLYVILPAAGVAHLRWLALNESAPR